MMWTPSIACATLVGLLIYAEIARSPGLRAVVKSFASLAFVAQAFTAGALDVGAPGITVIVALILSLIGDLFLLSADSKLFMAGIGAFLLAHLGYIAAFAQLGVDPVGVVVGIVVLGAGTGLLARRFVPAAGELAGAVAAYVGVITLMGGMSVGSAVASPTPARLALCAAAIVFMASDVCVARDRFEHAGVANRAVGLVLYYGAQLVFAVAIAYV